MEKTQKRKSSGGFMRSLYKAAVKPNSFARCGSNKVKPSPTQEIASFGATVHEMATTFGKPGCYYNNNNNNGLPNYYYYYEASNYGVNKDNYHINNNSNCCTNGGFGGGGDENVDVKAASYISHVRERFKLEKADSDPRIL